MTSSYGLENWRGPLQKRVMQSALGMAQEQLIFLL